MKENKSLEKMKDFGKRKWEDFCSWFAEKEHPKSRLNKNVFFHDLLKIIGLILVFLIIYSNVDKLNKIIPIFINVGSLLELILIFFILRKAWHLVLNLKYAYKGLNHGVKAIIAIVVVILLLFAFLNQDKVVSSITGTYEDANFSKLNPVQISSNFSLFGSDKNSSSGSIIAPNNYQGITQEKEKIEINPLDIPGEGGAWFNLYAVTKSCASLEGYGEAYQIRNINSLVCKETCGMRNLDYSSNICQKDKLLCYCSE